MGDFFDRYIRYLQVERNLSPCTVRNYTGDIGRFLEFLEVQGIKTLADVDHLVIRRYLEHLLSEGIVRASIARKTSAIRSLFRYVAQASGTSWEPPGGISGPKRERRLPSFLTSEEMQRILAVPDPSSAQGLRDRAMLETLYAAGLRVSELAALDIGSLDLGRRQVRVWGKGSKERIVLIGTPAAEALKRYLAEGRTKLLSRHRSDALFLNRYGRRIAQRRIQYLVKKYGQRAGLVRRVYPHMLRHTFATHMLDGGADLRVVQELMGHSSLSSTQIYTHITTTQMRRKYLEAHPRGKSQNNHPPDSPAS